MSSLPEADELSGLDQKVRLFDLPTEEQFRGYLSQYLQYDAGKVKTTYSRCNSSCRLTAETEIGKSDVHLSVALNATSGFYMIRRAFGVGKRDVIEELFVPAGPKGELAADKMADYKVRIDDYDANKGSYGRGLLTRIVTINYDAGDDHVRSISYGGRTVSAFNWDRDRIFAEREANSQPYQTLAEDTKDMGIGDLDKLIQGVPDVRTTLGNILDLRGAGNPDAPVPSVGLSIRQ